jgi:hypothetical protein
VSNLRWATSCKTFAAGLLGGLRRLGVEVSWAANAFRSVNRARPPSADSRGGLVPAMQASVRANFLQLS